MSNSIVYVRYIDRIVQEWAMFWNMKSKYIQISCLCKCYLFVDLLYCEIKKKHIVTTRSDMNIWTLQNVENIRFASYLQNPSCCTGHSCNEKSWEKIWCSYLKIMQPPHSVRPRIFALILSIKGCMQSNSISIKMHRIAVFLLPLVALSSSEFTCPSPYAAVEPVVGQCQCARLVASPWRNQVRLHLLTLLLAQKQF